MGWRRVLTEPHHQPPDAPLSRGLEVHPHAQGDGDALDVWVERSLVRRGYGWRVPAGAEARIGVGSYDPLSARPRGPPTPSPPASTPRPCATRATGSRTACARPPTATCSTWATAPGTASRSRARASARRSTSASRPGASCARCSRATKTRERAFADYAAFHDAHAPAFRRALRLQRLVPALPPRVLTLVLRALGAQRLVDRAFGWYLEQAHPRFAQPMPR